MPINSADLGFEKKIWSAADKLRGNMDASEYKHVVLGLIFLKYISDSFEEKYQELLEEGAGFEEEKDEYIAENIFYVPEEARWSYISGHANQAEIGQVIDKAMVAIETDNTRLKGILPKNFARPELDKRRLGEVVDIFTNIPLVDYSDKKDILGRTYEYCLAMFAEQEGRRAGEFYTPSSIVKTLVEILEPYNGRVYDPACGSGTTAHAVIDMNKIDGGKRKYILCTNNENNICEEVTYQRLKNIQEDLPHNLKYFKTDFVKKFENEEDVLSYRLLSHIKEMVELENMCEIDGKNRILILTQEDLQKWFDRGITHKTKVYLPSYVLLSREIELEGKKQAVEFIDVPDYYFLDELREVSEI